MKSDRRKRFDRFYEEYSRDLYRFIYTLANGDGFPADDIFQNTCESIYRGIDDLRDESKRKSWMFAIARNEAKRYFYKKKNRVDEISVDASDVQLEIVDDNAEFADHIVTRDLIFSLIDKLDHDDQRVVLLHHFYDMSLVQIATTLHENYNTVKSQYRRSIKKLCDYARIEERYEL